MAIAKTEFTQNSPKYAILSEKKSFLGTARTLHRFLSSGMWNHFSVLPTSPQPSLLDPSPIIKTDWHHWVRYTHATAAIFSLYVTFHHPISPQKCALATGGGWGDLDSPSNTSFLRLTPPINQNGIPVETAIFQKIHSRCKWTDWTNRELDLYQQAAYPISATQPNNCSDINITTTFIITENDNYSMYIECSKQPVTKSCYPN